MCIHKHSKLHKTNSCSNSPPWHLFYFPVQLDTSPSWPRRAISWHVLGMWEETPSRYMIDTHLPPCQTICSVPPNPSMLWSKDGLCDYHEGACLWLTSDPCVTSMRIKWAVRWCCLGRGKKGALCLLNVNIVTYYICLDALKIHTGH